MLDGWLIGGSCCRARGRFRRRRKPCPSRRSAGHRRGWDVNERDDALALETDRRWSRSGRCRANEEEAEEVEAERMFCFHRRYLLCMGGDGRLYMKPFVGLSIRWNRSACKNMEFRLF